MTDKKYTNVAKLNIGRVILEILSIISPKSLIILYIPNKNNEEKIIGSKLFSFMILFNAFKFFGF